MRFLFFNITYLNISLTRNKTKNNEKKKPWNKQQQKKKRNRALYLILFIIWIIIRMWFLRTNWVFVLSSCWVLLSIHIQGWRMAYSYSYSHQTEHFLTGLFFWPGLQLNTWPNSAKFEVEPITLFKRKKKRINKYHSIYDINHQINKSLKSHTTWTLRASVLRLICAKLSSDCGIYRTKLGQNWWKTIDFDCIEDLVEVVRGHF